LNRNALLKTFLDSQYELRSGWKFAIYVALLMVLRFVTGTALLIVLRLVAPAGIWGSNASSANLDLATLGLSVVAFFIPAVLALIVMARFEKAPASSFGTRLHPGWFRHILVGIGFAFLLLIPVVAGSFLFGETRIAWLAPSMTAWTATLLVLMIGAANEEIVFRGYPMQTLMRGVGTWPAILIMSAIFGLLHAMNPDSTAFGVFNTILAGILLSAAYLRTRSLWLAYGVHAGWNVGLGIVLGFPVSGLDLESLFATRATGPEWILGGPYGPEGGLLATAVFLGGTVLLLKRNGLAQRS
jgi:membrane protease YdiL (CAAX protease family)